MKERIAWLKSIAVFTVLSIALAGCASIEKSNATDAQQMLAAAGFKMKLADTPEKLAHLKTLTQRKVVPHDKDGKPVYIYADAEFCRCLYAGDEDAYDRYEKMVVRENVAEMNEAAEMNWGMWGPGMW
ncbi:hypothetical protein D1AOALGA4SA_7237 [Olavius algarvensis Delta 1 endosymbiont]|nr:hypothetical protein D1AOALGA4SA_7237 [Olavius algarvensis Delta 1 endosymbiont]